MSEELKTYHGNCHCGAFKFSLTVPEIKSAITCNCSICARKGAVWLIPGADQFTVEKGDGTLTSYSFGSKTYDHRFCPTCGTGVMAVLSNGSLAVNLNCLRDFDVKALELKEVDGKSLGEPYQPVEVSTEGLGEPETPDLKTYKGHCHCGAVKLAFRSPDLSKVEVLSCNCSICTRNGYILTYPARTDVSITGLEHTTGYKMGAKFVTHRFCATCGVPVFLEVPANIPPMLPEAVKERLTKCPVNLRCVDGLDWEAVGITKVGKGQEGYVVA